MNPGRIHFATRDRVPVDGGDERLAADCMARASDIRALEVVLLDLFRLGQIAGTVHTCVGEEIIPVALHPHLNPNTDAFFATHRGHGHFIASGGSPDGLIAEMLGREGAVCLGRGGSQNLHHGRFFSHGIQGAGALHAVGYAWALQRAGIPGIVVAQLGDGTMGQGATYEAMSFAALLRAPVLFLIQHNGWAQSTAAASTTTGDLLDRAQAFGLDADRRSDADCVALHAHFATITATVRTGRPFVQLVDTQRLLAHSKGDDTRHPDTLRELHDNDPLEVWTQARPAFAAHRRAMQKRWADLAADIGRRPKIAPSSAPAIPNLLASPSARDLLAGIDIAGTTVVAAINAGLQAVMADARVLMIGEDIADPCGGAFRATRGLSTAFPERVFSTPIAEAAIVGVSVGAALAGFRPVAEIMFGDFATLAADQLINSAAKYPYALGGEVTCPLVVRFPSGGGFGYGPTHSQSLERLFCGEPGLRVVALSPRHDARVLLRHTVCEDDAPVVFVEPKPCYGDPVTTDVPLGAAFVDIAGKATGYPPLFYRPAEGEVASVTVVTYGHMTTAVEAAMETLLLDEEIFCDYFVVTQLWPLDTRDINRSVARTGRLLVVEPHVATYGFGAAVIHEVAMDGGAFASRTVGARSTPIPCARHLEDSVLPGVADIESALRRLAGSDK